MAGNYLVWFTTGEYICIMWRILWYEITFTLGYIPCIVHTAKIHIMNKHLNSSYYIAKYLVLTYTFTYFRTPGKWNPCMSSNGNNICTTYQLTCKRERERGNSNVSTIQLHLFCIKPLTEISVNIGSVIPCPDSWVMRCIIWVRSRNCSCFVTWFCYQLIAKPGNKTATVPWLDPYIAGLVINYGIFNTIVLEIL